MLDRPFAVALFVLCSGAVSANLAYFVQVWTLDVFAGDATVIAARHALSAAHCFDDSDHNKYYVLGSVEKINGTGGVKFNVDKIIKHPSFDDTTMNFDIAVIRVVESFLELPNVAFVPVQTTFISSTNTKDCWIFGWGVTVDDASTVTLQKTLMHIRPQVNCVEKWTLYRSITSQMFCAESDASDVCRGDGGGSLICSGRLVGVVSWEATPCEGRGPTFFTRVSDYETRKFIRDQAGV